MTSDKAIEGLRKLIKEESGNDYSREQIIQILALCDLMVDIASGEFTCQSCKQKYKIYGINIKS